jgi:hypothetical protein
MATARTSAAPSAARPAAGPTLSVAGSSPTAIGLSWTETCTVDSSGYVVSESTTTSSGPFVSVATIPSDTTVTWGTGSLTPGATAWWEVSASGFLCSSTSNVVENTQPTLAYLNYTLPTGSSAEFNWTNNATYGTGVAFNSYGLYEEIGGGAPSLVQSLASEGSRSYTVTGLSGGLGYTFFVNTTDCFANCGATGPSYAVTGSNAVTFGVAVALASSISVVRNVVDANQSDLFSCNPSGGVSPYTFSWDFGNGTSVPGPSSESASYSTPSTPLVQCVVTDHAHTEASAAISILVDAAPVLNVTANATSVDVGQPIALACTPSLGTPAFSVTWEFGDSTVANGASVDHAYATPGSFAATCIVTDATTTTVTRAISLTVSPKLTLAASASSAAIAPGTVVSLVAHATNGSGTYESYSWTFSGGGSATTASVSHAFSVDGPATATVVVIDSNGAMNRSVVSVEVVPITVHVVALPTTARTGQMLTFNATAAGGAGGPYNFTWNFGDGITGYGTLVTHQYARAATYDPTVVVTDRLGAKSTTTVGTVAASVPPPPPPLVPLWALLLLVLIVLAVIAAVGYREFRRRRSAALRSAAPWAPPTDPNRTIRGQKPCPTCGTSNVPMRETCESCGADLPRRTFLG